MNTHNKIYLYVEASFCGGKVKQFNVEIKRPTINLDELIPIMGNEIFVDPTGLTKRFLEYYGVGINLIRTKSREMSIRKKRQELIYFLYCYTLVATKDIASLTNTSHANVTYSYYTVLDDMQYLSGYSEHINKIRAYMGLDAIIRVPVDKRKRYIKKYDDSQKKSGKKWH